MKTLICAKQSVSESDLRSHVEKISSVKSKQDIINLCSTIAENLGTSYFTYTLLLPSDFHSLRYKVISNLNATWTERYKKQSYILVDPGIRECMQSFIPVFWDTQKHYSEKLSINAKTMIEDAHEHGLRAGVLVPVFDSRGINGVFGLGLDADLYTSQSQKHLQQIVPYVSYLGGLIHQSMIKLFSQEELDKKEPLTKREKDCLCWAADGKTASEIGLKLYISENTVKFHSKNIMKKLGAKNTVQALAISILNGTIKPLLKEVQTPKILS